MLGRQTFIDVGTFAQPRNHEVLGFEPSDLTPTRHISDGKFLKEHRLRCLRDHVSHVIHGHFLASIHRSGRCFGLRCSNSPANTSMQHHATSGL